MSAVIHIPWTNRLTKMIAEPGGVRVDEALKGAEQNLETMRESCLIAIDARLAEIEKLHRDAGPAPDQTAKDALYALGDEIHAVAGVFGLNELGAAAFSLCELVDGMRSSDRWNTQAMDVHLGALRLFREPRNAAGAGPVLAGLRRVIEQATAGSPR